MIAAVYLLQVTYTPLHQQSAWTADAVAPHSGLATYNGSLPHLKPSIATTTQTFTTSPGAPLPRPPATLRNRPLSAGSRNRQLRDRPVPDANLPTMPCGKKVYSKFVHWFYERCSHCGFYLVEWVVFNIVHWLWYAFKLLVNGHVSTVCWSHRQLS